MPLSRERGSAWSRWYALVVFVLALLCYANATDGPFLFDDIGSILHNPNLRSLTPLTSALDAPHGSGADGRPLVALSLALNYAAGGFDVFGYHVVNILLHGLTALALFGFVRVSVEALGSSHGGEAMLNASWLAFAVASLWAVHPLHTATIHHVIQRSGILAALFYLCTLYAAARSFESARGSQVERAWPWTLASVVACALGAASKEIIVSAPLVVLLYDRCFFSGSLREALRRHRALYVGLGVTWLLLAFIVSTGSRSSSAGFEVAYCPPIDYLLTQTQALTIYLMRVVWPRGLVFDYGNFPIVRSWSEVPFEGALIFALLALSLFGLVRNRAWGWLATSAFLVLAPTSSFIPLSGAVVAEHRMYLASAAVVALLGMSFVRCAILARLRLSAGLVRGIVLVLVGALFTLTWQRNQVFATGLGIWEDTVHKRPDNARAWDYYGQMLAREGRENEAAAAYLRAIEAKPDVFAPRINLGNILMRQGKFEMAGAFFAQAAQLDANRGDADFGLGICQLRLGRAASGATSLTQALASPLEPAMRAETLRELGWLLATSPDDELRDSARALELAEELTNGATSPPRHLAVLAAALAELGRFDEAVQVADQALQRVRDPLNSVAQALRAQRANYARREPWRE